MSEYLEDEYEDDFEDDVEPSIHHEIAHVRELLEEQREVAEVNARVAELQRQHGERFTPDEVDQLGALIDEGHDPQAAYEYVAPQTTEQRDLEREYAHEVERFERTENRSLSDAEQARIWQAVVNDDEEVPLHDVDTREGRQAWAAERLSETFPKQETPEVVETPRDDASAADRRAYMEARLSGASQENPPNE